MLPKFETIFIIKKITNNNLELLHCFINVVYLLTFFSTKKRMQNRKQIKVMLLYYNEPNVKQNIQLYNQKK